MLVSASEKKPATSSRMASVVNSHVSEIESTTA